MSRRRRKPGAPAAGRRDPLRPERQLQGVLRGLRRPSKGYAAKRPRTAGNGAPPRVRGDRHDQPMRVALGEMDGFAEIDEVVFVGPRTGVASTLLAPVVDPHTELEVVSRLLRKRLPALELEWMPGEWLDLRALGSRPLVLYCQPGLEPQTHVRGVEEQEHLLGADAAQSRGFAERSLELASMNHRVVCVSSQSSSRQMGLAIQEALPHLMLSDDGLELAEDMGLPTFELDGACVYERITLIVRAGRVEKVFYPVPDPATHAAEVAQWLREGET